jgi:hypothetical protein
MIITINTQTTIKQILENFANRFPFLKIEFFIDANKDGINTANEMIKDHNLTLGSLANQNINTKLEIHGTFTIDELEHLFKNNFGVIAQVFYKRNNNWLVTSTSDKLTLNELNQKAEDHVKPVNEEGMVDAADRMELE